VRLANLRELKNGMAIERLKRMFQIFDIYGKPYIAPLQNRSALQATWVEIRG